MTDVSNPLIVAAFIEAVALIISSIFTYMNGKKIDEIHVQFNGRMDQLLNMKDANTKVEVTAAHAQGMKDENERFKG